MPERPVEQQGYAISTIDGSPIYFRVSEPAQPAKPSMTVVLCDGIGCDGFVWKYLRRDLARQYRVIHWHYRGHGRTPRPRAPDRVAIPDLADDLASVLDECQVDRAVVAGHSMGVQVSLETYRRHQARVQALILVCGAPGTPLATFYHDDRLVDMLPRLRSLVGRAPWLFNRLSRAVLPTRASYALATLLEVNADLLDQKDFMPYLRGISRVDIELFLDMLAQANQHTARDLLDQIAVPVLIIAGSQDGFTPAALSREMHEAIPGSRLLMVDNGSHTAPIERPEQVDAAVLAFLAECQHTSAG